MVQLNRRRAQFAMKVEASAGTAETLAGTEVDIRCENPSFRMNFEDVEVDLLQSDLSHHASIPGMQPVTIGATFLFAGSGVATTPPALGKILQMAGFSEAIGGSDVTYVPVTPAAAPWTVGLLYGPTVKSAGNDTGKVYIAKGCRVARATIQVRNGGPVRLVTEIRGSFSSIADTNVFTTGVSYEATIAPTARSLGLTLGAWTPLFSELDIVLENTLGVVENPSETSGISHYNITDRTVRGSMNPLEVLNASKNIIADVTAGTEAAFAFTLGSAGGNTYDFSGPKVQIVSPDEGDRDGHLSRPIGLRFNRSSGDDELSIVHS